MDYRTLSYPAKLDRLLEYHQTSTRLAQTLGVSRMSVVNWRDDDARIKEENRLKIDIAYCRAFSLAEVSATEVIALQKRLADIDFGYFSLVEEHLVQEVVRQVSFGSLEVENSSVAQATFDRTVQGAELMADLDRRAWLEIHNQHALNQKLIHDALAGQVGTLTPANIRHWHYALMQGIRTDAGEYSRSRRLIPGTDLVLTDARDIPEEMEYWCRCYQRVASLFDIARAHAHFELIHPFGNGNGRFGRLLMAAQCLTIGLIPPLINKANKALYYVVLEYAQKTGNENPLALFLGDAILALHGKLHPRRTKRPATNGTPGH
ncbi:MAG: hypothetical protein AUK28_05300 [Desulfobacterales bacterium CG2_30_60_27]|nr:MAG: hypothetical protein AUK28_05300 [Desulfobacterales bacterium CG2_30_60_27]